jgi:hypothetical protein
LVANDTFPLDSFSPPTPNGEEGEEKRGRERRKRSG